MTTFYFSPSHTTDRAGREADLEQCRKGARSKNPIIRKDAEEAAKRIANETRVQKDMREALIKAHRSGSVENVKDIHEYIKNKSQYR